MTKIPMAGDVASVIGEYAEKVENRNLLLNKFVFHKKWGLDDTKSDEANRWSLLRVSDGGKYLLNQESKKKRDQAEGRNVELENRAKFKAAAQLVDRLANTNAECKDAQELRKAHSLRLRELLSVAYGERATCLTMRLQSRLAINLTDSLIQNAGICLDRLFGLPYVPGSAGKGVARHQALHELKVDPAHDLPAFVAVFGCSSGDFSRNGDLQGMERYLPGKKPVDQKGAISFLPAYPLEGAKIVVDVTTVHYPDYYRSGDPKDLLNEKPQPNPFPVVEQGAIFSFPLVLNGINADPSLLKKAATWLEQALSENGIGAKTGAGYGWFAVDEAYNRQLADKEAQDKAAQFKAEQDRLDAKNREEAEKRRTDAMTPFDRAKEVLHAMSEEAFSGFAKILSEKSPEEQKAFVILLRENKEKRERWKVWKKKKPDLAKSINAVSIKLGEDPLP